MTQYVNTIRNVNKYTAKHCWLKEAYLPLKYKDIWSEISQFDDWADSNQPAKKQQRESFGNKYYFMF